MEKRKTIGGSSPGAAAKKVQNMMQAANQKLLSDLLREKRGIN